MAKGGTWIAGLLTLPPYAVDGAANDAATAWCAAATAYGTGDRGTPGAPNPPCAGDEVTPTQITTAESVERYLQKHSPVRPRIDDRWVEKPGHPQAEYLKKPYLPES